MAEFVKVANLSEVAPEASKCVEVNGRRVGLFNLAGVIHAIDDACPHADASLSEGHIAGMEVVCPLHFATFNLETGKCTGPPADEDVATYPVRVSEDGTIEVALTTDDEGVEP